MTTLREKRHDQVHQQLIRALKQREAVLVTLVRIEGKVKACRRTLLRYEKLAAKEAPAAKPAAPAPTKLVEPPRLDQMTAEKVIEGVAEQLGIPPFLQRQQAADRRDQIARDAILAEQEERKKNKARVRIETMKAKKAGELNKMPLTGKAALAAIRGE